MSRCLGLGIVSAPRPLVFDTLYIFSARIEVYLLRLNQLMKEKRAMYRNSFSPPTSPKVWSKSYVVRWTVVMVVDAYSSMPVNL